MKRYYNNGYGWILKAISDKEREEFHVTPVITLSMPNKNDINIKWGYAIALEWGFWAIFIGIFKSNFNH